MNAASLYFSSAILRVLRLCCWCQVWGKLATWTITLLDFIQAVVRKRHTEVFGIDSDFSRNQRNKACVHALNHGPTPSQVLVMKKPGCINRDQKCLDEIYQKRPLSIPRFINTDDIIKNGTALTQAHSYSDAANQP
jgi:hypothetical protein